MIYIIAWIIIGVCTYYLMLDRMEWMTQKAYGVSVDELLVKRVSEQAPHPFSDQTVIALFRTTILVTVVVVWPLTMLKLIISYAKGEKAVEEFKKRMDKLQ